MVTVQWTENSRAVTNAIRDKIGRPGAFEYLESVTACTLCTFDPNTGTSLDSFCPQCSGLYNIPNYEVAVISGHITWGPVDNLGWYPGGQLAEGQGTFQIEHTQNHEDIVEKTVAVIVDGRKTEIMSVTPRGVPEINRLILKLKEYGKEDE